MNRISWLFLIAYLLLAGNISQAQDQPKVDLFVGYATSSFRPNFETDRKLLYGWNGNVAASLIGGLMITADVSGQYGSLNGHNMRLHTVMFGPRFAFHGKRWSFYSQSLYGVATISGGNSVLTPLIGVPSDSGFASVPGGGGVEIKINERLAYRLIQFDLLYTKLGNDYQMMPRFATGLAFHFGKTK
jgi:hypothetical protein